ncbi:hypothetical protein C0J52_12197 [Blattella germanica]|nr:hypothetical protein C0J52_12197 [Blattella germanica]
MTADVVQHIQQEAGNTIVGLLMYADDMVLASTNKQNLQEAANALTDWAYKNQFDINKEKTVQMMFRKGGKIPPGQPLKIVNSAKYLGITLQTTTRSYRIHIQERATASTRAMFTIKNIQALSLDSSTAKDIINFLKSTTEKSKTVIVVVVLTYCTAFSSITFMQTEIN